MTNGQGSNDPNSEQEGGVVKQKIPENISDKLFEIAGYKNISATAFMARINNNIENRRKIVKGTIYQVSETDKKIYIPVYLNRYRAVGCVDSGSDLTLIHLSLFKKIFKNMNILGISDIKHVTTFSNHSILVRGQLNYRIKLYPNHPGIHATIYVIDDIQNVPSLLLGNDLLKAGLGLIAYSGSVQNPQPEVMFNYPVPHNCRVFYEAPEYLFTCTAQCNLGPFETQNVEFYLPSASPVLRNDHILITAQKWDVVSIVPSRTDLEFVQSRECYVATGCIVNLSKDTVKCEITGKFELINDYLPLALNDTNKGQIRAAIKQYPVGREVIMSGNTAHIQVPIMSINQVNLKTGNEIQISDLELADTVMDKEPTYYGEAEIRPEIIEPQGLDLPTVVYANAEEAIDLTQYSEELRPYIKSIFIDKYPEVVALHSLDAGNISLTLGFTQLRLREGEILPRSKRIFHISPSDQRHLDDICDLLIKFGYIMRAPVSPNGCHLYGMSAYLVPRSKPNCLGRLIVDFSPVNQLIQSPSAVIPEISATLQFLQGKALYSSLDLKYAYLSLRIDEESRPLTTFLTPTGSFQWLSLPTGAANSPAYFTDACNKILHYEPVRDENGQVIYESKNVVKQVRSPLKYVTNYFDDILATSLLCKTYSETLKLHFEILEEAIKRLAFHGAKISVMKCEFAKSKILFLGWYISHDFVIADPRRIEKIRDFKFPESKKSVRAFLGLVNSLRRVINIDIVKQLSILTPLTSSKANFQPTEKHKLAFEQIKKMLINEPLFGNLIDEKADKLLWVDAATSSGVLGAVLAQKIVGKSGEKLIPECLDLDDEVHRILFDKELKYEPVKLYTSLPIPIPKPTLLKTVPPNILREEKLLGFTEENVHDSFFWSTISILALYNCALPTSTLELRNMALKNLKKGILNNKLKDFVFNLNFQEYQNFLIKFAQGKVGLDPEFYLAESLAKCLHRPITIVSSLARHREKPIIHFNSESDKPPLIYGLYQREGYEIFKPFFINKHVEFKLDQLKNKMQIIAYVAKTVPEAFKSRPILDLEVFAILTALYSLQRFISGVKVTLLTDSRVLFYLFSSKVGNSSVKIRRWCLKLLSDYPLVTLHFVRTNENLADFLTREGLPPGDYPRFNLKDVEIKDFYSELPKTTFTLPEWINFVEDHPEYLTINTPDHVTPKAITLAINRGIDNVKETVTPIDILKEKLSRAEIVKRQKIEFTDIYSACLAADNFEYTTEHTDNPLKYRLVSDLLMIFDEFYKILIPPSMVGLLLSYTHLLGHKGLTRMLADLQSYSFKNKYTVTKNFINCCYSCFLSQTGNKKSKIGIYPTPNFPFQEITMDLAENLNTINGYSHLLIVQCTLTDFVIIHPLKSKTSAEITRVLTYSVLQNFNVQKIHSDNGPGFRSLGWLEIMSALGITIIATSALHPSGRGQIERLVGTIKLMLKKMLATRPSLNWEYLPYICSKVLNNTVSPKLGYKPMELVFGKQGVGQSNFDIENMAPPHYLVKNHKIHINEISREIQEMTKIARERLTQLRLMTNEKVNKNRLEKTFKINDYVFVLDRYNVPGNPRPLHTKLQPSPYIVVRPLWTTTLVKRLADGFTTLYSNDDLKKYNGGSPLFSDLPVEISKVLLHSFTDLLASDLTTITKYDNLDLPQGIQLYDPIAQSEDVQKDIEQHDKENIPLFTKNENMAPIVKDEFSPEDELSENTVKEKISEKGNEMSDSEEQDMLNLLKGVDRDQILADLQELQATTNENVEKNSESENSDEENDNHLPARGMNLRNGKRIVTFSK